jgi:hypothetical protein
MCVLYVLAGVWLGYSSVDTRIRLPSAPDRIRRAARGLRTGHSSSDRHMRFGEFCTSPYRDANAPLSARSRVLYQVARTPFKPSEFILLILTLFFAGAMTTNHWLGSRDLTINGSTVSQWAIGVSCIVGVCLLSFALATLWSFRSSNFFFDLRTR